MEAALLNHRKIRIWLAEHDMTQGQLAAKAKIAPETLSRGMTGRPIGARALFAISRATGVSMDDLLRSDPHPDDNDCPQAAPTEEVA